MYSKRRIPILRGQELKRPTKRFNCSGSDGLDGRDCVARRVACKFDQIFSDLRSVPWTGTPSIVSTMEVKVTCITGF